MRRVPRIRTTRRLVCFARGRFPPIQNAKVYWFWVTPVRVGPTRRLLINVAGTSIIRDLIPSIPVKLKYTSRIIIYWPVASINCVPTCPFSLQAGQK